MDNRMRNDPPNKNKTQTSSKEPAAAAADIHDPSRRNLAATSPHRAVRTALLGSSSCFARRVCAATPAVVVMYTSPRKPSVRRSQHPSSCTQHDAKGKALREHQHVLSYIQQRSELAGDRQRDRVRTNPQLKQEESRERGRERSAARRRRQSDSHRGAQNQRRASRRAAGGDAGRERGRLRSQATIAVDEAQEGTHPHLTAIMGR